MARTSILLPYLVAFLSLFALFESTNAQTTTPVVGANSTCANRLKIETMQSSQPDAFNLLVVALNQLQTTADSNDLSWYQLSGIHGAPFIPWQMPATGNYDRTTGYCTHHSVIFTTWHRPYLLLLEQVVYQKAVTIASAFTGTARTKYLAAAQLVRLPYWDWSDPTTQSHLPTVCMQSTISVVRPDASGNAVTATIANPLYSYAFTASSISTFSNPFNVWRRTLRQPTSSGTDRESTADATMQSGFSSRKRATFNCFSQTRYNGFSAAVENIHDSVHGSIGGNGHMSYIPYSAFDPIFWLHHVQIDRLTAMFQAASPGLVLASGTAVGTFARPAGSSSADDINTPLYPFRNADNSWWTSAQVSSASSIWANKYGYPEVPCSYQTQSAAALDSFTTTQINRLYGTTSTAARKRATSTKSIEWDTKIVVDQAELAGSFEIYVFLGTPESDSKLWPISDNEVGTLTSLGFPGRKKKSNIRSGTVPLTQALEEKGIEGSVEDISAYLKENLTWVVLANSVPVDVKTLKTLKVAVTSTEVTTPDQLDKLPVWGTPAYHFDCTSGKVGGASTVADIENPTLVGGGKGKPATG